MPIIKVRKEVKLSENLVEVSREYKIPETVLDLIEKRFPMKYDEQKGAYYTKEGGGIIWYAEDYIKNELKEIERNLTDGERE